ncbi:MULTISPECIES: molybdopterin-dependent oxidoreductase [Micromonospora]|uniref:Molybdopterin-binding oxidoreductase n=1 Tax=Micromonospora solifontis TaxID=2487138 RepID=A0ABX9WCT5_9ACTN|nr:MULTISPECIES: molybdopterin-dependent oxidoreductase [Micromonospora]NES12692.1 molybdopterin-dependent oxidoreductase [Micromonospora sp. PPF5-17B]NES38204.1 molybdopterin-dependent oxidoreductase [Micromonospora solifontis]NES54423.1 molybdopterin-dependent oxidoreductase [Micromonospora sp. PPF5-6]RNL96467.1 molybdopterin-binding oxidoreductase [Micromonospora solifontis]
MSSLSRGHAALAGVTAAAVAVGVAEPVAVLTGFRSAPLIAVGGLVVDLVPEALKHLAISLFGTHDKIALLIGTAVLLAAIAGLLGVLAARRLWLGLAGIAAFAALGVAAALTRPGAGPAAALPSLVGGGLGALTLWALIAGPLAPDLWPWSPPTPAESAAPAAPGERAAPGGPAAPGEPRPAPGGGRAGGREEETDPEGRRRFLRGVGVLAGTAAVAGLGGHWLAGRRGVSAARRAVTLPAPSASAPAVPAGADLSLAQLAPYVTPNSGFYRIDTALVVPQVDPATWRLRIHGRVRKPIELTFEELLARPMVERYVTLACVSNEVGGDLIGNARWLGVPIKELLDEADPEEGADQVVGRSVDGWTCGTPTAVLRDGRDALLAVGMNGEPLPVEHGFPVRMVVPGLYGYVSACKWVTELELTSFADFDAYWVPRGWSAQGPIKTESRIDTPRPRNRLTAGPVTVAGVAWAQHRGIRAVEVRVDGGPWRAATLAPTVSVDTWVQWSWRWDATPGEHTLQVRATDADGVTQTPERRPVAPDGATGWHSVKVTVR